MTVKESHIELFRKYNFNCFPIPIRTDNTPNQKKKAGDYRYNSDKTAFDQAIREDENYGVLPTEAGLNAWVDFDDKEEYRFFAELMIKEKYVVSETPHGWHIPVINLGSSATKKKLHNFSIRDKALIEIQGTKSYVVGIGSKIVDSETKEILEYKSVGGKRLWDFQGKSFDTFVEYICNTCNVEDKKKSNTSHYQHLRNKFKERKLPTKGQSNDYFMQAGVVLLDLGRNLEDAISEIKIVFDEWKESKFYTGRLWSDEVKKIEEVYENKEKYSLGSGRKKGGGDFDREGVVDFVLENKIIYSLKEKDGDIFENENGFLERINDTLSVELKKKYRNMSEMDYKAILFSLRNLSPDIPKTNKNHIRFPTGSFDITVRKLIQTDELADMGFTQYNYLPKTKANEPKEFLNFFKDYRESDLPRVKMALRSVLSGHKDFRITWFHGISNVGKSLILTVLSRILGDEYALQVDWKLFFGDRATESKANNKRMVVFLDVPDHEINVADMKGKTGESQQLVREFGKAGKQHENKVKYFATANKLPVIKEDDKNAMFTNRLSLCRNTREKPYIFDPNMEDRIVENEGEKILSYILNLSDEECAYEEQKIIQKEWEELSEPELNWIESNYTESDEESDKKSVRQMLREFNETVDYKRDPKGFTTSIKKLGYSEFNGVVKFIKIKPKPIAISSKEQIHQKSIFKMQDNTD
ncbi:MAG: hypothetical protein H8D35_02150 [Nitrosopumilus sp.]|nr:hypothetical protein [Nitrosopumilus sp.]